MPLLSTNLRKRRTASWIDSFSRTVNLTTVPPLVYYRTEGLSHLLLRSKNLKSGGHPRSHHPIPRSDSVSTGESTKKCLNSPLEKSFLPASGLKFINSALPNFGISSDMPAIRLLDLIKFGSLSPTKYFFNGMLEKSNSRVRVARLCRRRLAFHQGLTLRRWKSSRR